MKGELYSIFLISAFGALLVASGVGYFLLGRRGGRRKFDQTVNPDEQMDAAELGKNYLVLAKSPEVLLGEEARFQHMELVGSSGTGKTRHGILPYIYQDIQRGAGVIVLDVKSNLAGRIAAYAQKAGRAADFVRFEVSDPDGSVSYSSLVGDEPTEVANRLWTALYLDDETPTPFYRESAMSFIRNFMTICKRLEVLPTLKQLREVVADQDALDKFVRLDTASDEAKFMRNRFLSIARAEYVKNFEGLVNKLAPLTDGPFAKILNTTSPELDMAQVIREGKIAVFGLAADKYPADYRVLSTLILMDLQASLTDRYHDRKAQPIFVYLDEVADLVYPEFRALVAKARESRVGLILAHQALGDLRAVSEAFMDSVVANTSNKVIFRLGTADTAEQMSRLAGTKTVVDRKTNYSLQGGLGAKAKGYTDQDYEQFLLHPNDLKNLAVGEAAFIVQRKSGRRLYKGMTWSNEELAKLDNLKADPTLMMRRPPKREFKALVLSGTSRPSPPKAAEGGARQEFVAKFEAMVDRPLKPKKSARKAA